MIIVLITENMPEGERGLLTQWLVEAKAGVYIGKSTARIRDIIWQKVKDSQGESTSALMIYSDNTEQGYSIRMFGNPRRYLVDFEGLTFIATKNEQENG